MYKAPNMWCVACIGILGKGMDARGTIASVCTLGAIIGMHTHTHTHTYFHDFAPT